MNKLFTVVLTFLVLMTSCAQKNDVIVKIKTPYGEMIAILYDDTPLHKENFIKLAEAHYFDSLLFHRVIPDFMIQTGDSASRHANPGESLGRGGKRYTIPAEFLPNHFHEKGALSAARQGDHVNVTKASSGSQFYIVDGAVLTPDDIRNMTCDVPKTMTGLRKMFDQLEYQPLLDSLNKLYYAGDMNAYQNRIIELAPRVERVTGIKTTKPPLSEDKQKIYTTAGGAPHLDGEYTVFGKVIKGLEVIDKIAAVPRDSLDRPLEDVRMISVTIEKMSKKKITKDYGYVFPVVEKK
ncbi:MAG: peptidylprolyl isomerase [Cyclobacteriaceae bacterium]|nr:peptidylprolyl isomerase [Cyclobacteriaceae bacterium]